MGAAAVLSNPRVQRELSGTIILMAVPAEEYVEVEYRHGLQQAGKLEFLGGKPELIARGEFDDVDLAMMIHTHAEPDANGMAAVNTSNNGCVVKQIRYQGVASHAGAAPERGVNALYAPNSAWRASTPCGRRSRRGRRARAPDHHPRRRLGERHPRRRAA